MPRPNALRIFAPAVVLALPLFLSSCSGGGDEAAASFSAGTSETAADGTVRIAEASRPYVKTLEVRTAPGGAAVRAPARVAFRNGAVSRVDAQVGGTVSEVHVKVGDHVEAGQALVALNSPDAAEARAALASATAEFEEARREMARHDQMSRSGVDVPSERAAAQAKLSEAGASLEAARAKTAYLGEGDGPTVSVKAPIAGTVLTLDATTGAYAEPGGDPMLEIGNPQATWIVADVFERDLPLVTAGAKVTVDLPSVSRRLAGHVDSVGAAVASELRTAPVYVSLDDGAPALRAGMYARVTVDAGDTPGISLPTSAVLVKDGTRTIVYVEKGDGSYLARDVKTGASIEGSVRILDGLAPGEKVVSEGALLLDGAAEQLL
jgi:membrane fusion protein, heavy metal efflux system